MSSKEEIFDYVMETPQNTNPAILKDLLKDLPSSDLPDPSTLTDGTAMVAVNGEWKMQDGYGYTEQTVITWDGDTEGRETFSVNIQGRSYTFYRVSDSPYGYPKRAMVERSHDPGNYETAFKCEGVGADAYMSRAGLPVIIAYDGGNFSINYTIITVTGSAPTSGVYFVKDDSAGFYVKSLTAPFPVHQFDSALIPSVVPAVPAAPSEDGQYFLTCAVTDGEAVYSWESMA